MTFDLNQPVILESASGDCHAILLRIQDGEHLFLLVESATDHLGALQLRVGEPGGPSVPIHGLQEASGEGGAWSHLSSLDSPSATERDGWERWLDSLSSDESAELAFLDAMMGSEKTLDPYGFESDDESEETRDVDDGERQSLLAALRETVGEEQGGLPQRLGSPSNTLPENSSDWLDGLGEDLGGLELVEGGGPAVSSADFEALLDSDDDSALQTIALDGDDDDWTEDSVNWQSDTEDTLLEGPATLAVDDAFERIATLAGPPEFTDDKDVPDDFALDSDEPEDETPQRRLEARQEAEFAALLGEESQDSASEEPDARAFAQLVDEDDTPPLGFSVPASEDDFADLVTDEPSTPEETLDAPTDPSFERDDRGLHVHWESNDAFTRDYDSELCRKRLTIYGQDAPAPGTPLTVWLHLPDAQVLALSARLSGAETDRYELRLDLPLVTKGKLKRVAHP